MPSGREAMSKLPFFCLADMSQPRICVPTSDAIEGSIGEGVEEIMSSRKGKRIQVRGYHI